MQETGDVVIIPAGVAHKCLSQTSDFGVTGAFLSGGSFEGGTLRVIKVFIYSMDAAAYPPTSPSVDMCYGRPGERPGADTRIAAVPLPPTDPIYGTEGVWQKAPPAPGKS
jgi:uncharacterized protein YjlB